VLAQSGHDVTFLARGSRAAQLRASGLVLRGALGDRDMNFPRPIVLDRLEPQDRYDMCLVTVRREQIESIVPTLAASTIPLTAFMHNHACFTYRFTMKRTTTTLKFKDPNNEGNNVRITLKGGSLFARLVKEGQYYDQAGNRLAAKPNDIGIPIRNFRVPDNFYPQ